MHLDEGILCFNVEARPGSYWYDVLGREYELVTPLQCRDALVAIEAFLTALLTAKDSLEEQGKDPFAIGPENSPTGTTPRPSEEEKRISAR